MSTKEAIKKEWRRMDGSDKLLATVLLFMVSALLFIVTLVTNGVALFIIFLGWAFIAFMNWFSKDKPHA